MNIVFVCTGNTCRSPMAEGFLKASAHKKDKKINVCSRGLSVVTNSNVSKNSVDALKEYNIDISSHEPKQISLSDIENADLIITMTSQHAMYLKNISPNHQSKITSLADYTLTNDISDPYGCVFDVYKECAKEIKNAVSILLNKILNDYE